MEKYNIRVICNHIDEDLFFWMTPADFKYLTDLEILHPMVIVAYTFKGTLYLQTAAKVLGVQSVEEIEEKFQVEHNHTT